MTTTAATKTAAAKFQVVCMDCGKTWWVRVYAEACARCGNTDIEVAEDAAARRVREDAANIEAQRYV